MGFINETYSLLRPLSTSTICGLISGTSLKYVCRFRISWQFFQILEWRRQAWVNYIDNQFHSKSGRCLRKLCIRLAVIWWFDCSSGCDIKFIDSTLKGEEEVLRGTLYWCDMGNVEWIWEFFIHFMCTIQSQNLRKLYGWMLVCLYNFVYVAKT